MKFLLRFFLLTSAAVALTVSCLEAQFVGFKAKEGIETATTKAKSDGLANPQLTFLGTIGDTTGLGDVIPAQAKQILTFKFDASKGTSTFWGYRLHDKVGSTDSVLSYAVVKLIALYQSFALPFPDIPQLPIRIDSALPSQFMGSDVMAAKITATASYQNFLKAHKDAKFQLVALGMSRGGVFPQGPLWTVLINAAGTDPLMCFVEAGSDNGSALCIEPTTSVSDRPSVQGIYLYPNPAVGSTTLHIPIEMYSPATSIEIFTTLGERVRSYSPALAGGYDVILPTGELAEGSYFVRFHTEKHQQILPLTVSR